LNFPFFDYIYTIDLKTDLAKNLTNENYSINGEAVISLSDFKPGAYIIKLQTDNSILARRIIVQ
jgi:hypothetical protein